MKVLEIIQNSCLNAGIPVNNTLDTLKIIRQLEIGFGCPNQCSSCFSSAPIKIIQMELSSFKKIMRDIGRELLKFEEKTPFFYLGAATDPRAIKCFHKYYKIQCKYSPKNQMIKTFSHGWDLHDKRERKEAQVFLKVFISQNKLKLSSKQRLTLSFDQFSLLARQNWDLYLNNFIANLSLFEQLIKFKQLRIETTYVPDYLQCNPKFKFENILNKIKIHEYNSYEDIRKDIAQEVIKENDINIIKTTMGLLFVLEKSNIPFDYILNIVRDNRAIFPAGRGLSYFKGKSEAEKEACLKNQEEKVLYSLENLPLKNLGLIIKPNGCINVIDYRGYKFLFSLNSGLPVISGIKCFEVNK